MKGIILYKCCRNYSDQRNKDMGSLNTPKNKHKKQDTQSKEEREEGEGGREEGQEGREREREEG